MVMKSDCSVRTDLMESEHTGDSNQAPQRDVIGAEKAVIIVTVDSIVFIILKCVLEWTYIVI